MKRLTLVIFTFALFLVGCGGNIDYEYVQTSEGF